MLFSRKIKFPTREHFCEYRLVKGSLHFWEEIILLASIM